MNVQNLGKENSFLFQQLNLFSAKIHFPISRANPMKLFYPGYKKVLHRSGQSKHLVKAKIFLKLLNEHGCVSGIYDLQYHLSDVQTIFDQEQTFQSVLVNQNKHPFHV